MSYKDTLFDREGLVIDNIEADEDDVDVPESIEFTPRDNPDVAVDTSGRFVKHEIIGGDVVRQKIGESPIEISVDGVCDEGTAKDIDKLRNAKRGTLISDRITVRVQFASMSTEPLESGGAVDISTGDYLYTYSLELIGLRVFNNG